MIKLLGHECTEMFLSLNSNVGLTFLSAIDVLRLARAVCESCLPDGLRA